MDQTQIEHERDIAAFNQNHQTFRALNQLMWQIPIIAMTLTGGLWFGVSRVDDSPLFQTCLLFLACAGNVGLFVVLGRLRYIMGEYLTWLERFHQRGFVPAKGRGFGTSSQTVRWAFHVLLGLAAAISGALMVSTMAKIEWRGTDQLESSQSRMFYNRRAAELARNYEALDFEKVHPELAKFLAAAEPKRVLDVGSGSGRDAAWMAAAGHRVIAVEPSEQMRLVAQGLHRDAAIRWVDDALPALASLRGEDTAFDVIVLSAVWMHIHPEDRQDAFARIEELLAPGGVMYLTLRTGASGHEPGRYPTSKEELEILSTQHGLDVRNTGDKADLLLREGVRWRTLIFSKT